MQPHPFFTSRGHLSSYTQLFPGGIEILKVEPEVEMGVVDKNTKSLEILEEVPIRKVPVEFSNSIPEGILFQPSKTFHSSGYPGGLPRNHPNEINPLRGLSKGSEISEPREHVFRNYVSFVHPSPTTDHHPPQLSRHSVAMPTTVSPPTHSRTSSESSAIVALTELASQGRTTQEVMSAKTLLSLHGPGDQPITCTSSPAMTTTPTSDTSSTSTPTPGRTKKMPRKQKPVASARSVPVSNATPHQVTHHKMAPPSEPLSAIPMGGVKRKEYTPEELLRILDIPSKPAEDIKKHDNLVKGCGEDKWVGQVPTPSNKIVESHKVVQVSEDESESSDSSSGSESSSEEEEEEENKEEVPITVRKSPQSNIVHSHVSTSSESSSEEEERPLKRARGGKGRGQASRRGNVPGNFFTEERTSVTSRSVRGRVQKIQRPPLPTATTKGQRYVVPLISI